MENKNNVSGKGEKKTQTTSAVPPFGDLVLDDILKRQARFGKNDLVGDALRVEKLATDILKKDK